MSERRIEYLDGWRGLAILLVLADHFGAILYPPLQRLGSVGVDFFFVLSGRLMADLLVQKRQRTGEFAARRLLRIVPPYAAYLAVVAAASLTFVVLTGRSPMRLEEIASASVFGLNYYAATGGATLLLGHLWSVCVEVHAYVLLLLITRLSRRWAGYIAVALAIAAVLNGWLLVRAGAVVEHGVLWRSDVRAAAILAGFAAFLLVPRGRLISTSAIVAGCALELFGRDPILRFAGGAAFLAIGLAALDMRAVATLSVFEARPLRWLGMVSYSLYLWQVPFAVAAARFPALLLPCLLGALVFGWIGWRLIEVPAHAIARGGPLPALSPAPWGRALRASAAMPKARSRKAP